MSGFRGVWTEQWHRTACLDGPHTWHLMLCGCHLESLSIFSLNFCFVNEVWRTLEACALVSSAPRPSVAISSPLPGSQLSITWCLGPGPTAPSPRLPSRLWALLPSTQCGNQVVLCCETHIMRSIFFCDPLPPVGPRKVGVGYVYLRNAFRQGVGDSSHPCQGWQHHSCWGEGVDSPGKGLLPAPSLGTEHVLVLRLQWVLRLTGCCRSLQLEGGVHGWRDWVQVPGRTYTYPASILCPGKSH